MFNLLRLLALFLLLYLLYRLFKMLFPPLPNKNGKASATSTVGRGEDLVKDPNCQRYLPLSQAYSATVDGEECHFCSRHCYEQFILTEREKK